jgi:hypothetical protein
MTRKRKRLIEPGESSVELWSKGKFGSKEYLKALAIEKVPIIGSLRERRQSKKIAKQTGERALVVRLKRRAKLLPFELVKAGEIAASGGTSLLGDLAQSKAKTANKAGKVAQQGLLAKANIDALKKIRK